MYNWINIFDDATMPNDETLKRMSIYRKGKYNHEKVHVLCQFLLNLFEKKEKNGHLYDVGTSKVRNMSW